jgi:hypothetical protein
MKYWLVVTPALLILSAVFITVLHREATSVEAVAGSRDQRAERRPVVVELFTSEGCSSCPPADAVLTKLQTSQPVSGAEVIVLSEHVDYWNRLGWTDPFSNAIFSRRQSEYAQVLRRDGVYTPQMIVDGRIEFVGSSLEKAKDAISAAARDSKSAIKLSLSAGAPETARLTIDVEPLAQPVDEEKREVVLAITEDGLESSVSRGENSGRRLRHSAVVRRLDKIGVIDAQSGIGFKREIELHLAPSWRRDRLRAVVFLEEESTRRIVGASSIEIGAKRE